MIYGFLSDSAFKLTPILEYGTTSLPPVCYLDDNMVNYFQTKLTVTDPRATRNETPVAFGKLQLHVDSAQLENVNMLTMLTDDQLSDLFSLFEYIEMNTQIPVSQLQTNIENNSVYADIYKVDTLVLGNTTISTGSTIVTKMVDYFVVTVKFIKDTTTVEIEETFKVWLNRNKFLSDYPLSTLCKVVLPCDPSYLLNPGQIPSIVDAIIDSNSYAYNVLGTDITNEDHTGLLTFYTKYNVSSTSVKMLPFGILYKGAKPSTMIIRKSIRTLLEGLGIAASSVWESLLPDLYVTGQFFIVPVWDNTIVRPDRVMFPSIIPVNKLTTILPIIFPDFTDTFVDGHLDVLTIAQSEVFILAIPDPANDTDMTLLGVHPTYQYYSPQDTTHMYMGPKTKDFSIRLNRCMAVLAGETVLEEFSTNTFNERDFLSFVSYENEYHVLTKETYMSLIS